MTLPFLDTVIKEAPFPIRSIQVDGGCEFMVSFEKACQKRSIPLYVLPPRSPEQNAFVERSNGIVKHEFYALYNRCSNLIAINQALKKYKDFYNLKRPHAGLHNLSPMQYYQQVEASMS